MNAWEALQRAIVERLKDSPAVQDIVADRVYDQVPRNPIKPYVDLGLARAERFREFGCAKAWNTALRIFVVSDEFGRKQAWNAMFAIEGALEDFKPVLAGGHNCTSLSVSVIQDSVDPTQPIEAHLTVSTILTAAD